MSFVRRLTAHLRSAMAPHSDLEQAIELHEAGRLDEAEARYTALLAREPANAAIVHLLGVLAHQRGRHREAIERIREAIGHEPGVALYHFNLANALLALGEGDAAIDSLKHAVALDPDYAAAWFNLGEAEYRRGGHLAAVEAARHAFRVSPGNPEVALALARHLVTAAGAHLLDTGAYAEAAQLLEPRWQQSADPLETRLMLAYALQEHGHWTRAVQHYEGVIAQTPDNERAQNNLANCYNMLSRRADAVRHYREVLRLSPGHALAASSILSTMNYDEQASPADIFEAHRAWARTYAESTPWASAYPNTREPERRLRVGYVSPDLRRHVVSCLLAPVLERHDAGRFESYCYYNYPRGDAVTERLRRASHYWREVHALDDEQLAARVREDGIDILVDLAGHTSYSRLLAFARKPAPVQVSWLGYFYTTGLAQIDAFVSDVHSSPPGQDRWFSEALVRLPDTRFVFEPHEFFPPAGPLPALARGHVSFGCLNNLGKLNRRVLALWGRVLERVPGSRLILQSRPLSDAANCERFLELCEQSGLPRERIDVRPWVPLEQSARTYLDIDIALDPFPFCGGMTSFDCLWMGVPVVTLEGTLIAARQTTSMLMNLGLDELIAADQGQYADIAVRLANDPGRLAALRSGLRSRMLGSPLCDYGRFTRELEKVYSKLWLGWCARGGQSC